MLRQPFSLCLGDSPFSLAAAAFYRTRERALAGAGERERARAKNCQRAGIQLFLRRRYIREKRGVRFSRFLPNQKGAL